MNFFNSFKFLFASLMQYLSYKNYGKFSAYTKLIAAVLGCFLAVIFVLGFTFTHVFQALMIAGLTGVAVYFAPANNTSE